MVCQDDYFDLFYSDTLTFLSQIQLNMQALRIGYVLELFSTCFQPIPKAFRSYSLIPSEALLIQAMLLRHKCGRPNIVLCVIKEILMVQLLDIISPPDEQCLNNIAKLAHICFFPRIVFEHFVSCFTGAKLLKRSYERYHFCSRPLRKRSCDS